MAENENKEKKENLSREDLSVAKSRIKSFLAEHKKLYALQGVPAVISALATVADKLSRGNDGSFKPSWLYTFLTTNVLSGSTAELVEYHVLAKQAQLRMGVQKAVHEEFDSFPIAERQRRNPEKIIADEDAMNSAVSGYLGSKGRLIAGMVSASVFLGTTVVSGGLANLPIMGATAAVSAISSYFINKKLNTQKIEQKNTIREQWQRNTVLSRQMYNNSVAREISDVDRRVYGNYEQEQGRYVKVYRGFTNMLSKYAVLGTVVKGAIIGGVVAATWATNPANVLVTTAAAMGTYAAVTGCVNSYFSLKEHVGNFAHAYKSFRSKLKDVAFGKEKINEKADTIEFDHIKVRHRDREDITQYASKTLFESNETLRIGKGITLLSGASGAGKSSLINLMLHSDDVVEGAIKIGNVDEKGDFKGKNYKDLAFAEPAKHIGLSLQNGKLSEMTVEEYIRLANPNADEKLVAEVKELVGIKNERGNSSCISPDLVIDPQGQNISGGQINRLNLAQALIKDSPILILDEPTAGVDATMSQNIVNYINGLKDKKTIVYITHNVDEIKNLQAYQALDIAKDEGKETATMMQFDLTKAAEKENYVAYFANRNMGRSSSAEWKELDQFVTNGSTQETQEDKVRKARENVRRAQEALDRLLGENSSEGKHETGKNPAGQIQQKADLAVMKMNNRLNTGNGQ